MKFFLTTCFVIASVQAALPLSKEGCQCTDKCKLCHEYDSNCPFSWRASKICPVKKENCKDYDYDKNGKVHDHCGSLADVVSDLYKKMKSWFHDTAKKINYLNAKVRDWAEDNVRLIDVEDLLTNEKEILPKLAAAWEKFDQKQLTQLKAASKEVMDKIIAEIPPEDLAALSADIQDKLDIANRILDRLKSITLEDVANWGQYLWDRIPINNLVTMSWKVLQKIPLTELGKWTQEQWRKIPIDKLVRFTGQQIAKIDAKSVAALSDKYWDKVPVYHIVKFSVELVQSAGLLTKLNATQIGYFTASQWRAIPVESIVQFTIEQLQAIDYVALGAWSKDAWDKMPIDKIAAFVDQQIESVPAEVVGNWTATMWLKFPTKEAIMFTGTQLIAGAKVLKDLTMEQLAQYDWSQISEDAFAQLPPELQKKIKKLQEYITNFNATEYKQRVYRAAAAKKVKKAKLEQLELVNNNPKASPKQKEVAQLAFNAAVEEETKSEAEADAEPVKMYDMEPSVADPSMRAKVSAATVLVTALWLQG